MSQHSLVVLLVAGFAMSAAGAQAPRGPAGNVTGRGVVELKRQPDILRVQVEILAKGKDLTEALARLKERREAARSSLATLGVSKDAFVFGEPSFGAEKTDQQKRIEAMVARQLRATGARTGAKAKQPAPTVLSLWLQFQMPLKASDTEELLLVSHKLQERIRAADLAGLKELEKLAAEDEEAAEEARLAESMGFETEPKRGEPVFLFVKKVSEEEAARALAEAVQKARQQAGKLARAAGEELGVLLHLETQNVAASTNDVFLGPQPFYDARRAYPTSGAKNFPAALGQEAVGSQPGPVTYRVAVAADFAFKAPLRIAPSH
jgi:uncharacterized protein YggE